MRRGEDIECSTNTKIGLINTVLLVADWLEEYLSKDYKLKSGYDTAYLQNELAELKDVLQAKKIVEAEESPRELYTLDQLRDLAKQWLAYGSLDSVLFKMHLEIPCRDDLLLRVLWREMPFSFLTVEDNGMRASLFGKTLDDVILLMQPTEFTGKGYENLILIDFQHCRAAVRLLYSKTLKEGESRWYHLSKRLVIELMCYLTTYDVRAYRCIFRRSNSKHIKLILKKLGIDCKGAINVIRSAHAHTAQLTKDPETIAKVAADSLHSVTTSQVYLA